MKTTSFWQVATGKHDVKVFIQEDDSYRHEIKEPIDLRNYVNKHYDLPTEELARLLLKTTFGAVRVEIRDFNSNGVIVEIDR